MKHIFVTFPTSPAHPYLHKHVVFASWNLLKETRYAVRQIIPSHVPFENNLHHCLRDFLDGDFDYWLSIDHDNPPFKNPLDLVEKDLDIVGFPTPVWHNDIRTKKPGERPVYWNTYAYAKDEGAYREYNPKKGLQEVDAIGTGCFLIARRVLEHPDMQNAPFQRTYCADGRVEFGNDLAFCARAKGCGFRIFAHFDYPCMHFVQLELNEIIQAFKRLYESDNGNS